MSAAYALAYEEFMDDALSNPCRTRRERESVAMILSDVTSYVDNSPYCRPEAKEFWSLVSDAAKTHDGLRGFIEAVAREQAEEAESNRSE